MKAKKILSVLLSAAMVLSMLTMSVMAAPAEGMPPDGMPGGPGGPGEGGGASALTLADPGYKYQTIQNVTSVSDVKTLPSLNELADIVVGATVNGEEVTGLLTMTKNGVEVPVEEGSYTAADKVVITATNYLQDAGEDNQLEALGSWTAISGLPYRTALSIRDGKIVSDESVRSAIGGAISNTAASGVKSESQTSGFSAMIIRDSDYKITNADINLDSKSDGKDVNDFAGYGAGVVVYGNSKVEIEDSNITTSGVAKAATFADASADLIVRNSTLTSKGGDIYKDYKSTANQSYMINPPWVLGIAGSSRTTNVMGDYTTGTYVNTTFDAADWGAVSIDTGSYMHLTLINSAIKVAGSGYGAYAIGGGTWEDYYGTSFDVDTYAIIMTGATASLSSVEKGDEIEVRKIVADDANRSASTKTGELVTTETATETANSVVNSKNFGFMFHHNAADGWNVLNLNPGTEINTGNAAFLVKKINAEINVNGADINSGNGVILQMIDNDDDGVGAFMDDFYGMPTFNYKYEEKDGWASTWGVDYKDSGWQTEFNVTDADLNGDLYNGTGYGSNGGSALNVNLGKGASLTGVISSTETQHGDSLDNLYKSFTYRKDDEGFSYDTAAEAAGKLGHVINQNYYNGVNPVNVTLTDDAAWTVTGYSIVNNLSAKSTAVTAEKPVIISVKGTLTLDGSVVNEVKTVGNVTYVPTASVFEDTNATWYANAADYAAARSIMQGTGNNRFSGSVTVNRGTVATMLARMSGVDTEGGAQWYSKGMEWAIANGITENTNATEAVSRQEIITMLWHALDEPDATGSLSGFSDGASTADWAREAMAWAVGAGVIQGDASGSLAPTGTLTRAQLAQIFYNYYTKAAK